MFAVFRAVLPFVYLVGMFIGYFYDDLPLLIVCGFFYLEEAVRDP